MTRNTRIPLEQSDDAGPAALTACSRVANTPAPRRLTVGIACAHGIEATDPRCPCDPRLSFCALCVPIF